MSKKVYTILKKKVMETKIQSVCDKLPNGKAGGLDKLVYEHLKYGGSLTHQALTRIFNAVHQIEYVAESWTLGNMFSILKKGKKNKLDKLMDSFPIQSMCYIHNLEEDVYTTLLSGNCLSFTTEELDRFLTIRAGGIFNIFLKVHDLISIQANE